MEFTISGSANTEPTKVNYSTETKYDLMFTDGILGTEVTVEDRLKLTFGSSFWPNPRGGGKY